MSRKSDHRGLACPGEPRGFTLIELMIVVVIMGVLATLGIYSVVNYIRYSKTAEPREIMASVMAGQDAYKDEVGTYLNVTGDENTYYPPDGTFDFDSSVAIQWGGPPIATADNFNTLGVLVNSAVIFRYAATTFAEGGAEAPPTDTIAPQYNPDGVEALVNSHVVIARSSLDGGDDGLYTTLVGSSMRAAIHTENLGE